MDSPDIKKIKQQFLRLIAGLVDEEQLIGMPDSFVEMEKDIVHIATSDLGHLYFRVFLKEANEIEYDNYHDK
jgi:hypothetical protein